MNTLRRLHRRTLAALGGALFLASSLIGGVLTHAPSAEAAQGVFLNADTCRSINGPCSTEGFTNLIASESDTTGTTTTGADQGQQGFRGAMCLVNITSNVEAASLTVTIQGKDTVPASPVYYTILQSASLTDTAAHALYVQPSLTDVANVKYSATMPPTWRVTATTASEAHSNPITYTVDCARAT